MIRPPLTLTRRAVAANIARGLLVALALALPLSACGKKNMPQPPPDQPVTYPRTYPSV